MQHVFHAGLYALTILVAATSAPAAFAQTGAPTAPAATPGAPAMPPGHDDLNRAKQAADAKKAPPKPVKKVDINNASVAELKSQLSIEEQYARMIVEHRPYKSKGELVTKAGLPEGVYHAVKRKIEMRTPRDASKSGNADSSGKSGKATAADKPAKADAPSAAK